MYNKVITIGNLTRDIELKYLPSGSAIANGAIATSHKYKKQNGEQVDEVCFLDFSIFGKGGEIFNQYVRKGSKVMLEGRLVFQQWKAQDGTNRSRHALSVTEFKFLDGKSDSQDMGGNNYNAPQQMNQPQQQNYNAQAQQYSQPAQQNYNAPQQQQSGGMHSGQNAYEQNIPTIDIDNDEIPF
ncbi:single-stranded DNA-binding protein [Arcobacter sp. 15-2]|uniref:single-stranded DNA-binding protein n=1 Tax=Arcobacter sp. 15-2 TaxID=3374109 RepID=UPI00399D2507